jgi:hypothetical protein
MATGEETGQEERKKVSVDRGKTKSQREKLVRRGKEKASVDYGKLHNQSVGNWSGGNEKISLSRLWKTRSLKCRKLLLLLFINSP